MPWNASEAMLAIDGPFNSKQCFYYDLNGDDCFSAAKQDLLSEQDIIENFAAVDKADRDEIKSFVTHKVFQLDVQSNSSNEVDAVWIRKWKTRNPPVIKSRMCGRGFLDSQKSKIDRHSSTASIMSHRLGLSVAAQHLE